MIKSKFINLFLITTTLTSINLWHNPRQIYIRQCKGYINYLNCQNQDNFDVELYMTPSLMGFFLRLYDNQVLNPYYESYNLSNATTFLSENFNNFNNNYPQEIHGLIVEGLGQNNMMIANYFRNFHHQFRQRGFYVVVSYRNDAAINNLITTIVPYQSQMNFLRIITDC